MDSLIVAWKSPKSAAIYKTLCYIELIQVINLACRDSESTGI